MVEFAPTPVIIVKKNCEYLTGEYCWKTDARTAPMCPSVYFLFFFIFFFFFGAFCFSVPAKNGLWCTLSVRGCVHIDMHNFEFVQGFIYAEWLD